MSERSTDLGRGESPRVDVRGVVVAVSLFIAGLLLASFGLAPFFSDRIGATSVVNHSFPAPGVTPDEGRLRAKLVAAQQAALEGAGGRMPIEAAMAAIAARGTHAFDPVRTAP